MGKMNVVFYISDQHRWDCMGAAGNNTIKTPNFDRFAQEGIRFNHMYSQFPLCGPSRACFVTGQYPQAHGARYNGLGVHPYSPKLSRILQENGYHTGMVGIVDLEPRNGKYHGYERYIHKNEYNDWAIERGVVDPLRWQQNSGGPKAGRHVYASLEHSYETHFSSWVAERSMDLLDEWKDEPFFVWIGDRIPHPPYLVPRPYDTMYSPEEIPLHPAIDPDMDNIDHIRKAIAHYYGLISLVDYNFGRVLERLNELGLDKNTIVIYCADHGNMIGHHGLYGKMSLYDDDVRIPFIIKYPGQPATGIIINELAQQIDVLPTVLELLGIDIPKAVQGRSMLPIINSTEKGREAVFAHESNEWSPKRQMIRTKDWKLIHTLEGGWLFDLKNDPYELNNLYETNEYSQIKMDLKEGLLNWHLETVDNTQPNLFDKENKKWIEDWLNPLV